MSTAQETCATSSAPSEGGVASSATNSADKKWRFSDVRKLLGHVWRRWAIPSFFIVGSSIVDGAAMICTHQPVRTTINTHLSRMYSFKEFFTSKKWRTQPLEGIAYAFVERMLMVETYRFFSLTTLQDSRWRQILSLVAYALALVPRHYLRLVHFTLAVDLSKGYKKDPISTFGIFASRQKLVWQKQAKYWVCDPKRLTMVRKPTWVEHGLGAAFSGLWRHIRCMVLPQLSIHPVLWTLAIDTVLPRVGLVKKGSKAQATLKRFTPLLRALTLIAVTTALRKTQRLVDFDFAEKSYYSPQPLPITRSITDTSVPYAEVIRVLADCSLDLLIIFQQTFFPSAADVRA
jgi:hypothetical protein